MKIPRRLMREARECAVWRGHTMRAWQPGSEWYPHIRKLVCKHCGMGVWVNPRPQPNDYEITGEAVALNCRKGA